MRRFPFASVISREFAPPNPGPPKPPAREPFSRTNCPTTPDWPFAPSLNWTSETMAHSSRTWPQLVQTLECPSESISLELHLGQKLFFDAISVCTVASCSPRERPVAFIGPGPLVPRAKLSLCWTLLFFYVFFYFSDSWAVAAVDEGEEILSNTGGPWGTAWALQAHGLRRRAAGTGDAQAWRPSPRPALAARAPTTAVMDAQKGRRAAAGGDQRPTGP